MVNEIEGSCDLFISVLLEDKGIGGATVVITKKEEDSTEQDSPETGATGAEPVIYKTTTNANGTVNYTLPYGVYLIHAECVVNKYELYNNDEEIVLSSEKDRVILKLYYCENEVMLNKDCKYFLHEPYMTPNNFDFYFDYSKIPVNNIIEPPNSLMKRLQRTMPLTKIIHLNFESEEEPEYNIVNVYTKLRLKYNSIDEISNVSPFKINVIWEDFDEDMLRRYVAEKEYDYYLFSNSDFIYGDKIIVFSTQEEMVEFYELWVDGNKPDVDLNDYETEDVKTLDYFIDNVTPSEMELAYEEIKGDVEVSVVRVNDDSVMENIGLDEDNNWEALTNPLPLYELDDNEEYDYNKPINYVLRYVYSDYYVVVMEKYYEDKLKENIIGII